ncbi:hypothetical protein ACPCKQ_04710 [Bacillus bombysepticus]
MHRIRDIIVLSDIMKLPKPELVDICTDLGLDNGGASFDLAKRIWDEIRVRQDSESLQRVEDKLLAGKTSVTWFELENKEALKGIKDVIIERSNFNPFENIREYTPDALTSDPILFCAAGGRTEPEYYLRYVYNSGTRRDVALNDIRIVPKPSVINVYINEDEGIIEVRADSRSASKVASSLAQLINRQVTLEPINILAAFGNNVERFADRLEGELIDTTSTPALEDLLDDFTGDHNRSILTILNSLNEFFDQDDEEKLIRDLREAGEVFEDHFLTLPFTALILCGMEKVGLRVNQGDLRSFPLYDYLRPHLLHQGGFVKFTRPIAGVEKSFTVRVGITTNSVYFTTPSNEEVIQYVRNKMLR